MKLVINSDVRRLVKLGTFQCFRTHGIIMSSQQSISLICVPLHKYSNISQVM